MTSGSAVVPPVAYHVRLPIFEGPLDLLLHLLQERRLDASLVSLATITGDYLAHVQQLEEVRAADLSQFLTIAAQLVVVKSRLLLPAPPVPDAEQHDPDAEELTRRLEAYRVFRDAAENLARRLDQPLGWYPHPPVMPDGQRRSTGPGTTLEELRLLAERVLLMAKPDDRLEEPRQTWISLEACLARFHRGLARQGWLTFSALLEGATARDVVVGMFLALLHLWKEGVVEVTQEAPFADILIVQANATLSSSVS